MQTLLSFDAGQTLVELDLDFLARRLAERGFSVEAAALAAAAPAAWQRFDALVDASRGHPWHELVDTLLRGAGLPAAAAPALVDWLWREQPHANLWRRPIPDMATLARELAAAGYPLAIVSNSEGRLADLLREVELAAPFAAILDSGALGLEKPDRRIFDRALALTGCTTGIHIGDSWAADIAGALGAGWRAIWYGRRAVPVTDDRVAIAHSAADVRAALVRWGAISA